MSEEQQPTALARPGLALPTNLTLPGNVRFTDFNDGSVKMFDFENYKGVKGRTDRIGILFPEMIAAARTHFVPDGGYVLCQSEFKEVGGNDVIVRMAPCCEKLREPRKRFAAMIIQYRTDKDGNLLKPLSYDLKVWTFGPDKYIELRSLNAEFPLAAHDLRLTCTDDNFQKLTIQTCRESVVGVEAFQREFGQAVIDWATATVPKLHRAVGKTLTPVELAEKLGAAGAAPMSMVESSPALDISDLLT